MSEIKPEERYNNRSIRKWANVTLINDTYTSTHLSETDKAYIAGLIDGEGTLEGREYEYNGTYKRNIKTFGVTISSTNKEVLDWVTEKLKVGRVYEQKERKTSLGKLPCYKYIVKSQVPTLEILKAVFPYLIIKKNKALFIMLKLQEYIYGN